MKKLFAAIVVVFFAAITLLTAAPALAYTSTPNLATTPTVATYSITTNEFSNLTFGNNLAPSCFLAYGTEEEGAAYDRCMENCMAFDDSWRSDPEESYETIEGECDGYCSGCLWDVNDCPFK